MLFIVASSSKEFRVTAFVSQCDEKFMRSKQINYPAQHNTQLPENLNRDHITGDCLMGITNSTSFSSYSWLLTPLVLSQMCVL